MDILKMPINGFEVREAHRGPSTPAIVYSIFPPVPVHTPFKKASIHLVADKKVRLGETFYHGIIETGDVVGLGQCLFSGNNIVLGESERT